jgi:hypothetical protein
MPDRVEGYMAGIRFTSMEKFHRERYVQFVCEKLLDEYVSDEGEIVTNA